MPFTAPGPGPDLTIDQPNNPIIPIKPLQQSDLIHVPAHCVCVRFVQGDALDRVYLAGGVHYAVDPGGTAFAYHVEADIDFFIYLFVRGELFDGVSMKGWRDGNVQRTAGLELELAPQLVVV